MMPASLPEYPIIDGFLYKTLLRCNLRFLSLAVAGYEALRRSGAFRSKQWVIPRDSRVQIPAFDSFELEVPVKPGSAIWGYTFTGAAGVAGILSFQVRDACNDVPWFSEFVTKPSSAPVADQAPLSKLYVIGAPGLLSVEIANTNPTAQSAQLILYGGEPVA